MRDQALHVAAILIMMTATTLAGKAAALPSQFSATASPVIAAQYYGPGPYYDRGRGWQRCDWLRRRSQEIEYRLAYAPPWEQPRLHQRLNSLRHEMRETCRW